jgi:hypothetical protein
MEKIDDYNIFSEKEEVACAYLKTKKSSFLPVKTYNFLQADPLSVIVDALLGLKKSEEAVIQIILKKAPDKWRTRAGKIIEKVSRGKSFDSALRETRAFGIFSRPAGKNPKIDEKLLRVLEKEAGMFFPKSQNVLSSFPLLLSTDSQSGRRKT